MRNYEKPMILANEELAEGVYAASGTGTATTSGSGSGGITYSIDDSNDEGWRMAYTITVTNSGSETVSEWSVSLSVVSGSLTAADIYDGWKVLAPVVDGNTITVKSGGGGALEAGKGITFTLYAQYSGGLEIK